MHTFILPKLKLFPKSEIYFSDKAPKDPMKNLKLKKMYYLPADRATSTVPSDQQEEYCLLDYFKIKPNEMLQSTKN